jgi:hypothetical protein
MYVCDSGFPEQTLGNVAPFQLVPCARKTFPHPLLIPTLMTIESAG